VICRETCAYGVEIDEANSPTVAASMGGTRRLTVTLRARPNPSQLLAAKPEDREKLQEQLQAITVSNLAAVMDSSLTARDGVSKIYTTQTPILTVNGTSIPFPYGIAQISVVENGQTIKRVQLSAEVSDTLLTDSSSATIRIAWPFYDPEKWSSSLSYSPPNAQFKVVRVSDNTFILSRINALAFVGTNNSSKHCWTLIASDEPLPFGTPDCTPAPAAPAPAQALQKSGRKPPVKKQPEAPQPKVTPIPSGTKPIYSFLFTLPAKPPSKATLVSSDGGIYNLDIPDTSDKKDITSTKITTLQQYDSAWIDINVPASKVPVRVETNGLALKWRIDPPAPKAKPDPAAATKTADKTMHVEITRIETVKPGLLDVVVFDKTNAQIVKQQVRITCTLCGDGGDK
jgi:hypothetical protein